MATKLITVKAEELKRGDSLANTNGYWTVEGTSWWGDDLLAHFRSTRGTGYTMNYHPHEPVEVWREEPFTDEEKKDLFG